jgi:hypothetical protein
MIGSTRVLRIEAFGLQSDNSRKSSLVRFSVMISIMQKLKRKKEFLPSTEKKAGLHREIVRRRPSKH